MTLPAGFWQAEHDQLIAVIKPRLEQIASIGVNAAEQKLNAQNIFFDNTLAHAEAARWAATYTDKLLQLLGSTTENFVGAAVSNWITTPGATISQLADILSPGLADNMARAWTVAVTETTRAYAEGNRQAYLQAGLPNLAINAPLHPNCRCGSGARRIRSSNEWVIVWETDNDELVCDTPYDTPWGTVAGCQALQDVIVSYGPYLGRKFDEAE
jgi:hypothetical protein